MSNTVSNNINLLAQGALEGFSAVMAPLNTMSTNFSPAPGQVGQAVVVNLYNQAGVADNFQGDYTTNSDQTINAVTVNLTQHFYKTVHATDKEVQNQGVDLFKLGKMAGVSVAKSIFTGAMGLITTGTYGLPVETLGTAANFAPSGMLAARTVAAPWGPEKNAIIDSSYYSALLGNLPNNNTLIQNEALADGSVGKLYGFNLYESNISPLAGGTTNTKAVFCNPAAIALASRYLQPDDNTYVESSQVTDPQTKATLGVRSWYEAKSATRYYTVEWLGGYSVGVTGAATVIYGG